jgi:alpha-amylase
MIDCATTLLLAPGAVQVFYGDETGRKLSDARFNVDSDQAFRSDMDWSDINENQLQHFQRLGQIRKTYPVIGTGKQHTIDVHTCARYNDNDTVVIRVLPIAGQAICLDNTFAEGAEIVELYTGQKTKVHNGKVFFPYFANNIAIIKLVCSRL